jgi:hypothetical protein
MIFQGRGEGTEGGRREKGNTDLYGINGYELNGAVGSCNKVKIDSK